MGEIGTKEVVIIAAIMVVLFGSKKIPELTKNLVAAVKNLTGAFKHADAADAEVTTKK